jgi:ribosomal protein S18 acetylase RimI-like enzyme
MHVLDNPVWHALTGTQATVAERAGLAARYVPEVAVFAALADDATPAAWDALAELVGPGGAANLARLDLDVPETWTVLFTAPCRQMWQRDAGPDDDEGDDDHGLPGPIVGLGGADVPEMLALVERTRPGPFVTRTVELGTYLGVRDGGELIAMAGERLHPAGFTEISAVCTDLAYRGRGLASKLVRAVVRGIRARGETPFLHLTTENDAAHRVYSALGFETRTELSVIGVQAPR